MRRIAAAVVLVTLLVACGDGSSSAREPEDGAEEPAVAEVRRIRGDDPYEVAAALAVEKYGSTSDPILASGEDPADALAGAYLGGLHASPVLLTRRDDLPRATLDALTSIGARVVHVLGGTSSISDAVASSLTERGFTVNRIAGPDRYATAAAAAREEGAAIVGSWPGEGRTALLANGLRPVDALTAGPLAYALQLPVLLTHTDEVPATTMSALDDLDIEHVMVMGGSAAVADGVLTSLEATGRVVRRIAGVDRAATAVAIARLQTDELGADGSRLLLAAASSTAEITAAGAFAAPSTPILLCLDPDACGRSTVGFAQSVSPREVIVVGDEDAVTQAAAEEVALVR